MSPSIEDFASVSAARGGQALYKTGAKWMPNNLECDHTMSFTPLPDDELVAWLLIHIWTLATGKTLRCDVPPHELTEEELIDFWYDDRFD
jgi:hypothetical protein